jgi:hypothetical protein
MRGVSRNALAERFCWTNARPGSLHDMGLLLVIAGLLLWLVGGYFVAGLIVLVIGVVLLFAPGPWYGYGYWRGRGGPP